MEGYAYLDCPDRVLLAFGVGVGCWVSGLLGVFALRLHVLGLNIVHFVLRVDHFMFPGLEFPFLWWRVVWLIFGVAIGLWQDVGDL